ncbi:MAG: hypothetical protein L0Z55_04535, partial [Planctomycetes bacterium]|nr:hypothetical protein [Planctomycetota bacterium]
SAEILRHIDPHAFEAPYAGGELLAQASADLRRLREQFPLEWAAAFVPLRMMAADPRNAALGFGRVVDALSSFEAATASLRTHASGEVELEFALAPGFAATESRWTRAALPADYGVRIDLALAPAACKHWLSGPMGAKLDDHALCAGLDGDRLATYRETLARMLDLLCGEGALAVGFDSQHGSLGFHVVQQEAGEPDLSERLEALRTAAAKLPAADVSSFLLVSDPPLQIGAVSVHRERMVDRGGESLHLQCAQTGNTVHLSFYEFAGRAFSVPAAAESGVLTPGIYLECDLPRAISFFAEMPAVSFGALPREELHALAQGVSGATARIALELTPAAVTFRVRLPARALGLIAELAAIRDERTPGERGHARLAEAEAACDACPEAVAFHRRRAAAHARLGEWQSATAALDRALAQDPACHGARAERIEILAYAGGFADALAAADYTVGGETPYSIRAAQSLVQALNGDVERAFDSGLRAYESAILPHPVSALVRLWHIGHQLEDPSRAAIIEKKLRDYFDKRSREKLPNALAQLLLGEELPEALPPMFKEEQSGDDGSYPLALAHFAIGSCHQKRGEMDQALRAYMDCMRLERRDLCWHHLARRELLRLHPLALDGGKSPEEILAIAARADLEPLEAIGRALEQALAERDANAFDALIDRSEAVERALRGAFVVNDASRKNLASVRESLEKSILRGEELLAILGDDGSASFLRARREGDAGKVLLRLQSPDNTFRYQEYRIETKREGEPRVTDVRHIMDGYDATEIIRWRLLRKLDSAPSAAAYGALEEPWEDEKRFAAIEKMCEAGQWRDAWRAANDLPLELRHTQRTLRRSFAIAEHLSREAVEEVFARWRRIWPLDPTPILCRQQYFASNALHVEAASTCSAIAAALADPLYWKMQEGHQFAAAGERAAARNCFRQAIELDARQDDAYWELVAMALADKDHPAVVALLDEMAAKLGMEYEDFTTTPEFADFVKSPEYQAWLARQPARSPDPGPSRP